MVVEKLEESVVKRLEVDLPPAMTSGLGQDKLHLWRGILLRSLVRAHLMLDSKTSADPAIELYFKREVGLDYNQSEQSSSPSDKPKILRVSRWPALVHLSDVLAAGHYFRTNARL